MNLSIIILNWNSASHLRRCLRSLETCTVAPREIIVVDNGSTRDESVPLLRELESRGQLTAIFNRENLGVGPARNQALAIARGEYILSLDCDTEVMPGAIERLLATMEERPEVGLCAARMRAPDGTLQFSCARFPSLQSKLYRQFPAGFRRRLLRDFELRDWDHRTPRYVDCVIGASHCMRRDALKQIEFYDPRIFYGPEDVDLCLRMWQAGWKVLYEGRAEIVHHERRVTKRLSRLLSRPTREHIRGLLYYFRKHRYLFRPPEFQELQLNLGPEEIRKSTLESNA